MILFIALGAILVLGSGGRLVGRWFGWYGLVLPAGLAVSLGYAWEWSGEAAQFYAGAGLLSLAGVILGVRSR